ncbi:hypothetical protein HYPSUDRAFT_130137 [Hypholoma sublateritium FD-334 SS-4]|uniref:SAM domain-containing protein n=1 Tax=Hypholoma sublateritium (strain FD-334 SS-4) TaxID=945553 RepID=A0A0D2Q9B8_HYPSF|nr:hypothetical protein HYPSUDRAFT_130137 [Hypholoma sublateritium FD-334 SS-4]
MNPNHQLTSTRRTPQRVGTGRAAYLLGVGPMPPPAPEDYAVALMNHALDGGQLHEEAGEFINEDENIVPPFNNRPPPQIVTVSAPVGTVTVRLPIDNGVIRDIDFPADIPREDFFDRIFANTALDRATSRLGWRSNDEPKRGPVHRLATDDLDDVDGAFRTLLKTKNRPRRLREVFMEIIHLNPAPIQARKKKGNDYLQRLLVDFSYSNELLLVQEKLRCGLHAGPTRWCYVAPEKPDEHMALDYAEISLWARSIRDNDADPDCIVPPRCIRRLDLRQRTSRTYKSSALKPSIPPIHVHINNAPLAKPHVNPAVGPSTRGLKRSHSADFSEESTDSDGDEEALSLSDVIDRLHRKFPRLNLPQYVPLFEQEGIVYAETVAEFSKDFYIHLGMTEGAVNRLLPGVKRILELEKRARKRARAYDKENSVEL